MFLVWVCAQECRSCVAQRRFVPGAGVTSGCESAAVGVRCEPRSSGRAASALKPRAISQAHRWVFVFKVSALHPQLGF